MVANVPNSPKKKPKPPKAESVCKGLFERPPGSGIYWIRWRKLDKKYAERKIGPSKRQAEAAYKLECGRVEMQLRHPEQVLDVTTPAKPQVGPGQAGITVAQLVDRYAQMTKTNLKNWKHYERYGRYWTEHMGDKDINDVLPSDIENYKSKRLGSEGRRHTGKRKKPIGPATVNREVKRLARLYELAKKDRLTTQNPCKDVAFLKEPPPRDRYLLKQEKPVLEAVFPTYQWAIVEIFLRTGMRSLELFGLTRPQLNFEADYIDLPETKSSNARKVPITPKLKAFLQDWLSKQVKSIWVFPSENPASHIDPSNWAERVLMPALERAGIYGINGVHVFRHSYASWLAMDGCPMIELMYLLGHRDIKTTMRYAHLAPGGGRKYQALLDAVD